MSERERLNEILRTGTIITVFLLVAVQFALFMVKAVPEWKSREEVPCAVVDSLSIDDTVIIHENLTGRRVEQRTGSAGRETVVRKYAESESAREEKTTPQGDGEWKWDVVELNSADSAELVSLPGIGAYYAKSILKYRKRLGSFVSADQLLEIRGIDSAKYDRLKGRVRVDLSSVRWLDLNSDSIEVLARHPYLGSYAAKGIERLRRFSDGDISPRDLVTNGIISDEAAARLSLYVRK